MFSNYYKSDNEEIEDIRNANKNDQSFEINSSSQAYDKDVCKNSTEENNYAEENNSYGKADEKNSSSKQSETEFPCQKSEIEPTRIEFENKDTIKRKKKSKQKNHLNLPTEIHLSEKSSETDSLGTGSRLSFSENESSIHDLERLHSSQYMTSETKTFSKYSETLPSDQLSEIKHPVLQSEVRPSSPPFQRAKSRPVRVPAPFESLNSEARPLSPPLRAKGRPVRIPEQSEPSPQKSTIEPSVEESFQSFINFLGIEPEIQSAKLHSFSAPGQSESESSAQPSECDRLGLELESEPNISLEQENTRPKKKKKRKKKYVASESSRQQSNTELSKEQFTPSFGEQPTFQSFTEPFTQPSDPQKEFVPFHKPPNSLSGQQQISESFTKQSEQSSDKKLEFKSVIEPSISLFSPQPALQPFKRQFAQPSNQQPDFVPSTEPPIPPSSQQQTLQSHGRQSTKPSDQQQKFESFGRPSVLFSNRQPELDSSREPPTPPSSHQQTFDSSRKQSGYPSTQQPDFNSFRRASISPFKQEQIFESQKNLLTPPFIPQSRFAPSDPSFATSRFHYSVKGSGTSVSTQGSQRSVQASGKKKRAHQTQERPRTHAFRPGYQDQGQSYSSRANFRPGFQREESVTKVPRSNVTPMNEFQFIRQNSASSTKFNPHQQGFMQSRQNSFRSTQFPQAKFSFSQGGFRRR